MKRAGLLAGLILITLASAPLVARWSTVAVSQPIPFNHRKHAENGLECSACHQLYQTSARAGRPENATCLLCHETPLTNTPEEQSLRRYTAENQEVPWRRLTVLPPDVYFSHRTHTTLARLDCSVCHGQIGQSSAPPVRPEIEMTMEVCVGCHKSRKASVDCLSCHR